MTLSDKYPVKIEKRKTCPVCSSDKVELFGENFDDRYGYLGTFDLYICCNCSHICLDANFDKETLKSLYTEYYPRSEMTLDDFRPLKAARGFNAWLDGLKRSAYLWVPKNVRVLDIGCGFGETLGYHKARGCEVHGVEADENIRRVADKYGFNVHVGLFDPNRYEPGYFDYVTLDQVIEHVTDPVDTLQGIAYVLKQGGVALLSTPNPNGWGAKVFGRRWINWHAPYHLQHFSIKSMGIAAEKAGLRIERVTTLTSSDWLHFQWIHLATYPEMGHPSSFWSPKAKPGRWEAMILRTLDSIHHTKLNHLLTRLFDAVGIGDNYLFFLRKP